MRGTVAVIFALTLVPMTFLVGAAVDYSGATNLLAHLQAATDGTGLRLCQLPLTATQKELDDVAKQTMTSYLGTTPYTISKLTPTTNPRTVELQTTASYPTAVLRAFGAEYSRVPVAANARCYGEPQTFEIALVLDTTGSMSQSSGSQSKMDAMKIAAKTFVDSIFDHPLMSKSAKMSLVPFAASVAVSPATYRSASWLDQAGNASHHWANVIETKAMINSAGITNRFDVFNRLKAADVNWDWTGCVESAAYPFNVKDDAPSSANPDSYYVPMWAADESGDGGQFSHKDPSNKDVYSYNSYINDTPSPYCAATTDETLRTVRGCKYLQPQNPIYKWSGIAMSGPNASCSSRPLTRMTNVKTTLKNEITALQPLGSTNIHEGFMWGWRTISPKSVFGSDAAPYGKDYNNKIVVLMTDGENMWTLDQNSNPILKSLYSAYGYFNNPNGTKPNSRLPAAKANPTNNAQGRAAMDALTLEACTNAQAAPHNVVIYTVAFSTTNNPIDQQGIDLLKTCAGSPSRAYVATNSSEIVRVFEKISESISSLRLSR